ncbi:hypothetical protein YC2023_004967 [Brassica napus]
MNKLVFLEEIWVEKSRWSVVDENISYIHYLSSILTIWFFDPGENQRLAFSDGSGPTMCLSLDLSDFPFFSPKAFIMSKRDVALGVQGYGRSRLTKETKTSPVVRFQGGLPPVDQNRFGTSIISYNYNPISILCSSRNLCVSYMYK